MLSRFLPKQDDFFISFEKLTASVVKAAEVLFKQVNELPNADGYPEQVEHWKSLASETAQYIFTLLHKTFITPFDRYDIHRLNAKIYDIVNMINVTTQRFPIYHIETVPEDVIILANICMQSTQLINDVVGHLHDMKHGPAILDACGKIKHLESQGDQILLMGVATLLNNETDIKKIIKLREIYELLETVTDRCQEVAFILEGIVLEYS
jgi:uncharacterized protein Yka (UPF0111/DUF47 family)